MKVNRIAKRLINLALGGALLVGSVASFGSSASAASTVNIDWYADGQDIDGFGASAAFIETLGASGFHNYSEPARSQILDLLFNQTNGIGLSWIRNRIPIIEPSLGVWDWTKDPGQLFVMNEAKARGVTRFMSTTWSPPGWMKTNGVANNGNGHLLTTQYQNYANYLSTYIREYKTRFNIDISAISVQNELDNAPDYEGTLYTAGELNNFIKNNLAPTFAADGITAKVIAPETSWWSRTEDWINTSLNDPASNARIDIVASHPYDGNYNILPTARSKGKKVWATEVSSFEGANDPSITDGLKWAKLIHNHMTVAESNAFFYWWLVSSSGTGEGLINISNDNTSYSTNKRLFTFGNYSRFIRPGYKRIEATAQPTSGVYVSAYKDRTANKLVVVAINDTASNQAIDFHLNNATGTTFIPYTTSSSQDLAQGTTISVSGGVMASTLPARSVTTFVGNVTPGAAPVMIDTLSNWNKMYSHTTNLQITNIGATSTEGDTEVLQRTTNTTESIIYNVNNSSSLSLKAYFNDNTSDSNNIKIYAGTTNGNYSLVTANKDTPFATTGSWYRVNYTISSLPANTNFVKIEIPSNGKGYFTPVLSQVTITPAATTTTTTLTDPLTNWSNTLSHTANLQLTDIGSTATEGDASVAQRTTNTTESIIYNVANSKSASVKIYFNDATSDSNNIKIYASSTNGSYVLQTASKDTPFATTGSWYRVNYTVSSLPANTNYIKVEIPANTKGYFTPVISEVKITY